MAYRCPAFYTRANCFFAARHLDEEPSSAFHGMQSPLLHFEYVGLSLTEPSLDLFRHYQAVVAVLALVNHVYFAVFGILEHIEGMAQQFHL